MSDVMRYWKEMLFFSIITVYYILGVAPDCTWLSQGGDAFDYVIGASNNWAVRPTGYPVYILVGWLFERLPFNAFWNLGLFSALSSVGTCIFIFLTIKLLVGQGSGETVVRRVVTASFASPSHTTGYRGNWAGGPLPYQLAPYIGALTYAGAFIIWTQSVIPEVYALTTLLMVVATYYALKDKWYTCAAVLAVSLGTHHLVVFAIVPLFVYFLIRKRRGLVRHNVVACLGIGLLGFLAYLQTQLCVYGQETTSGLGRVASNSLGTLGFLYTLPLNYTWWRLGEFIPMLLTSIGVGLVLLGYLQWRRKEIILLGVLMVLPISYYVLGFIPMWIVYMVPGIAFMSILIGIGASRLPYRKILPVFLAVPIALMCMNIAYYDLGRTVDPSPSTARQFYDQLDEVPDDAIFYIHTWGEPWLVTYYYLVENDNRFSMIFQSEIIHSGEHYTNYLESNGVNMPEAPGFDPMTALPTGVYASEGCFETFNTDKYLEDLLILNPGRLIYSSVGLTGRGRYDKLHFTIADITSLIGTQSDLIHVKPFGE